MYHLYKLLRQVRERWLSLLNSLGLGITVVLPSENHRETEDLQVEQLPGNKKLYSLLAISFLFFFFLLSLLLILLLLLFLPVK